MTLPKHPDPPKLAVVIAAAGSSRRFGADKLAERIAGRMVLEASIASLRSAVPNAPVVVVVAPKHLERWSAVLTPGFSHLEVVAGGPRRQDSVRIGVERAAEKGAEIVAIHDGARPLVHPDDVRLTVGHLGESDAAILGEAVSDTVKRIDTDGVVIETIDRARLRLAQTPQVIRIAALSNAWRRQDPLTGWSDEAALIEADGGRVKVLVSRHPNPKITTPADLEIARAISGGGS